MVCTYDFSGNCRAIRLCKPEIFEYRGFSPRITANSRDRELSLPQFALFVLFLPRLLRYTRGRAVLTQLLCCWILSFHVSLEEDVRILSLWLLMELFGTVTDFKLLEEADHSHYTKFGQHSLSAYFVMRLDKSVPTVETLPHHLSPIFAGSARNDAPSLLDILSRHIANRPRRSLS